MSLYLQSVSAEQRREYPYLDNNFWTHSISNTYFRLRNVNINKRIILSKFCDPFTSFERRRISPDWSIGTYCILYLCHLSLHHCWFHLVTQSQEPVLSGVYDVRCQWFGFICIVNSISGWGLYSDAMAFILGIFLPCRGTWKFRPGTGLNCTYAENYWSPTLTSYQLLRLSVRHVLAWI